MSKYICKKHKCSAQMIEAQTFMGDLRYWLKCDHILHREVCVGNISNSEELAGQDDKFKRS